MIPLYTQQELKNAKWFDKLPCQCYQCDNTFLREKKEILYAIRNGIKGKYCSNKCKDSVKKTKQTVICKTCNISFEKNPNQIKKTKNNFCSKSCAGTYNSTHKTHGNRRSKFEKYVEEQLLLLYPNLEIHFNKKDTINSEIDVYIPSLKIAFELNGIFHYKPIYGKEKFSKIQNNDHKKKQACIENNISLYNIDISKLKNFKSESAIVFLNTITDIINKNL